MATRTDSMSLSDTQAKTDLLNGLEQQMKNIWNRYVERLDQNGFDEEAQQLRGQYFNLYRCYKMNRNWIGLVSEDFQG